jgi:hypothetical protein
MVDTELRGWLPISIGLDPRPAIVSEALVKWMEFGSTPLSDPFFTHTVSKLRQSTPSARELETDLETMVRVSSRLGSVRPAAFIFHISRCGSTLLANALKTSPQVMVVSEPVAVTRLLLPYPDSGAYLNARWEKLRRTLLESIFSLLAHYRTGDPERLVIKFSSINTLGMSVIRSLWPDVPCVMVVRDPAEVIVASLEGGGWMQFKSSPDFARQIFGWDELSDEMSEEQYCARVLARFFHCALESMDDQCMVVDYEDLNAIRMREIAAFLGIELPPQEADLDRVFQTYSKDPTKDRRFHSDRAEKQARASSLVKSEARQWAMPSYNDIRARW